MKFLIVGLGNPGKEYEETRHNIGFKVVDEMARELGATFTLDKAAFRAEAKFKGRTIILIKPITFMNLSGKAVNYWLQAEKIEQKNLLVIIYNILCHFLYYYYLLNFLTTRLIIFFKYIRGAILDSSFRACSRIIRH